MGRLQTNRFVPPLSTRSGPRRLSAFGQFMFAWSRLSLAGPAKNRLIGYLIDD
jgi:hypothetical protein